MSWKDRLSNIEFTIKTGDGKEFKPLWKGGEKTTEFNYSKFEFINISGSLIDKRKPKGASIPLVFWFQGDDNIEQAKEFEDSSKDVRYATVTHPFYGEIKGQILKVHRNDNNYGVTEVTVDFWETITEDYPNTEVSLVDDVMERVTALDTLTASTYASTTIPETSDISLMKTVNATVASKLIPDLSKYTDYYNTVNKAIVNTNNLITDTKNSIADSQKILSTAYDFKDTVLNKVNNYIEAYETIKDSVSQSLLEVLGTTIITSICNCVVNPGDDDYITRVDIININKLLTDTYTDFVSKLDDQTVSIYNVSKSWNPDVDVQTTLLDLVALTTNQLYVLSFDAKQERSFELKKNSNLILLTHRFMGLASDENIAKFREINEIYNNEVFQIKTGRIVKWFV